MASLKDISLKCGVSIATVSKAINFREDVSEETREMVLKAARELGYSLTAMPQGPTVSAFCLWMKQTADLPTTTFQAFWIALKERLKTEATI